MTVRFPRRTLAVAVALALLTAFLTIVSAPAAEAETRLRWAADRDDLGLVDNNDVGIEGDPILIDGAGHPLLTGVDYDPSQADFFDRLGTGKIVAVDPTDGTEVWSHVDVAVDDFGDDPYAVLPSGDVLLALAEPNFDTNATSYELVVLDDVDGTRVDATTEDAPGFVQLGGVQPLMIEVLDDGGFAVYGRTPDASPVLTAYGAEGSQRWTTTPPGDVVDLLYRESFGVLLASVRADSGDGIQLLAFTLDSGSTRDSLDLGQGFGGGLTPLADGQRLVTTVGEAVILVLYDRNDVDPLVQQSRLSTEASGDRQLEQAIFAPLPLTADGSALAGVHADYFGDEGTGVVLRHPTVTVEPGVLDVGPVLEAPAQPTVDGRPAVPVTVPDTGALVASVPNGETAQETALYSLDADGNVLWELDGAIGIGTTHRFSEVCADGTLYGRSTVDDPGHENGFKAVWYAVAEAAPAVAGDGCERPFGGVDPEPSPAPSGSPTAAPTPTASPGPGGSQERIAANAAAEPIPLGAAVCQQLEADDGGSEAVVLARDEEFADALAGAPLAGDDRCILFTDGGPNAQLNPATRTEIERVLADGGRVYVLGGANAVSTLVSDELAGLGYEVLRLSGVSRYETAIAIADRLVLERGSSPTEALLAFGFNYADAVTGGAYGAEVAAPVLLTDSGELHPATALWLDQHPSVTATRVLGGNLVIADAVAAAVPGATRHSGDSRMGTAARIADELWRPVLSSLDAFTVVNLGNFGTGGQFEAWTVALAAAPYSAQQDAPQLGVFLDSYPTETRDYLEGLGGSTPEFTLIGGVDVIRPEVAGALPS